jgi:hypothetical protein
MQFCDTAAIQQIANLRYKRSAQEEIRYFCRLQPALH